MPHTIRLVYFQGASPLLEVPSYALVGPLLPRLKLRFGPSDSASRDPHHREIFLYAWKWVCLNFTEEQVITVKLKCRESLQTFIPTYKPRKLKGLNHWLELCS